MKLNEAMKMAIDGNKIRHKLWNKGSHFIWDKDEAKFLGITPEGIVSKPWEIINCYGMTDEWEVMIDYVDFPTAWKAYEEGKTIQSDSGYMFNKKQEKELVYFSFPRKDVRGKWLILED